jgi:hypothetical protein
MLGMIVDAAIVDWAYVDGAYPFPYPPPPPTTEFWDSTDIAEMDKLAWWPLRKGMFGL